MKGTCSLVAYVLAVSTVTTTSCTDKGKSVNKRGGSAGKEKNMRRWAEVHGDPGRWAEVHGDTGHYPQEEDYVPYSRDFKKHTVFVRGG